MLKGEIGVGFLGAVELFDKGALCLIEEESDIQSTHSAESYLASGKAHLEVGISDIGEIIKLYLKYPKEMKLFFNPRTQIVWEAFAAQFKKHELNIKNYKKSFIFDRLMKRVSFLGKSVKNYIHILEQDPLEIDQFYEFLNIHSSDFLFKNQDLCKELQEVFLPQIFKKTKGQIKTDTIKIWTIGCSTGKATLSLAIMIHNYLISKDLKINFSIFDTDPNYNYLKKEGYIHGVFSTDDLKSIPTKYHKYLSITHNTLSLINEIRSNIVFGGKNIISDQGFFNFDLIFCKNIFPSLKKKTQKLIYKKLNYGLKKGGLLVVSPGFSNSEEMDKHFIEKGKLKNTFFECSKKIPFENSILKESIKKIEDQEEIIKKQFFLKEDEPNNETAPQPKKRIPSVGNIPKKENFLKTILDKFLAKSSPPSLKAPPIDPEKEIKYLKKIEALEKELDLTKTSLSAASTMFEKTLEEQIQSSDDLKKVNSELTNLKDNLIRMVEERTEDLKKANQDLSSRKNQLEQTNKDLQVKSSLLKHTNLDLAKREGQLKDKTRDIEKSNKTLENLQKERALFFAKISHELRTPLNAILGFSDILLNQVSPARKSQDKQYLESIYSSGKSLLNLVNSVHDFTKIDLQELSVIKNKINIPKFLKDLTTYYTNECINKGLMFILDLADDFPKWIESDELRLRQVFDNILANALKFTHNVHIGIIAKASFEEGQKDLVNLIFQIEDTGRGIEEAKLDKLFKTFSQVHTPGSVQERGTGLGLYISQQIIEKLGGEISVVSNEGTGTTFTVTLNQTKILQGEIEEKEKVSYKFFGDHILIADDEPINISLYRAYLSSYDLIIDTAKNGEELVQKAKDSRPDLIITDYKMPIMTGNEAMKDIKKYSQDIPMILVSALKVKDSIKKVFQSFLQQPVEQNAFLKEISKYLKHDILKNEIKVLEVENIEFSIPDDLSKAEKELIFEIKDCLEQAIQDTEINYVERMAFKLSQKVEGTNLSHLIPWFNQLQIQASHFNIHGIENLLKEGLNKIKGFKKAS